MTLEIWITKRFMDYSTRKLVKWVVYQLRGSCHLENGLVCLSEPTGSIAKVLTDVQENFRKNNIGNLDHQKIH
ncbi:hypothetical protein H5410_056472 [Solanum commersonii]|uniref:Uncharacterized protein n=1 Tax=Solanum commersonii TaxID=4109 RepID=A0A9J5WLE2_SOLCO|nr:hypothetical protein H5410_056472 [Solanum commersonii]